MNTRFLLLSALIVLPSACLPAAPVISEFLADNDGGLKDEDGEDQDWIEVSNPDPNAVDLAGWRLTDDITKPSKWVFPSFVLQPGARVIVWASEKNRNVGQFHTNFQLDQDGEYLALISPAGVASTALEESSIPASKMPFHVETLTATVLVCVCAPSVAVRV